MNLKRSQTRDWGVGSRGEGGGRGALKTQECECSGGPARNENDTSRRMQYLRRFPLAQVTACPGHTGNRCGHPAAAQRALEGREGAGLALGPRARITAVCLDAEGEGEEGQTRTLFWSEGKCTFFAGISRWKSIKRQKRGA